MIGVLGDGTNEATFHKLSNVLGHTVALPEEQEGLLAGWVSRAWRGVQEVDAQGSRYRISPLRTSQQSWFSLEGFVDLVIQRPLDGTGDDGWRENWFWRCGTYFR